jgi:hypothetical protein
MADDVGITVPDEPHVPRQLDPAEHQATTDHQPVQVEAGSYTHEIAASGPVALGPSLQLTPRLSVMVQQLIGPIGW